MLFNIHVFLWHSKVKEQKSLLIKNTQRDKRESARAWSYSLIQNCCIFPKQLDEYEKQHSNLFFAVSGRNMRSFDIKLLQRRFMSPWSLNRCSWVGLLPEEIEEHLRKENSKHILFFTCKTFCRVRVKIHIPETFQQLSDFVWWEESVYNERIILQIRSKPKGTQLSLSIC